MTLLPARELTRLEVGELLRRVGDDLESQVQQRLPGLRIVHHGDDGGMQLRLDVRRQSLRRRDGLPRIDRQALEAQLFHRGDGGEQRRALAARDGQRAQFAGLDLRQARVDVHEGCIDLAAEQIGHGRAAALVRNVRAGGLGLLPEQFGREMVAGSVAGGRESHLAGLGSQTGQHIRNRLVRRSRRHGQHVGRLHHHADVVEVLGRIVGHALDQVRPDDERAQRRDQDRVAVRSGALGGAGAYRSAGAARVLHEERAGADFFRELRGQRAGDHVGRPARRKRNQQGHRLGGRPGLRAGSSGGKAEAEGGDDFLHARVSFRMAPTGARLAVGRGAGRADDNVVISGGTGTAEPVPDGDRPNPIPMFLPRKVSAW